MEILTSGTPESERALMELVVKHVATIDRLEAELIRLREENERLREMLGMKGQDFLADITRLRRIEEAAHNYLDVEQHWRFKLPSSTNEAYDELRAALADQPTERPHDVVDLDQDVRESNIVTFAEADQPTEEKA